MLALPTTGFAFVLVCLVLAILAAVRASYVRPRGPGRGLMEG